MGLGQRVLLHERELRQPVARVGVAVEQVADQGVGVAIDRRQGGLRRGRDRAAAPGTRGSRRRRTTADAGEEVRDDVAFFVGHRCPPFGDCRAGAVCGVDCIEPAMWRGFGSASMAQPQPARFDHRTAIHYHDQSGRARPFRGVLVDDAKL